MPKLELLGEALAAVLIVLSPGLMLWALELLA